MQTFISHLGELCRHSDEKHPVRVIRSNYSRHHSHIETGQDLRATLRAGARSWPGCYPLYFIASDGEPLSFAAVRSELRQVLYAIRHNLNDGWRVVGVEVNYEQDLVCSHTERPIPAAFSD